MIPEKEAWEEEAAAEAYQEALHRIRVAKETAAVHLDLKGIKDDGRCTAVYDLNRLPPELAWLGLLQPLDLSNCDQLVTYQDLPIDIYENPQENVFDQVRAHFRRNTEVS